MKALALRVVGLLLILSAIAVALSRAPDRPVETLVARWAPPPSDFLDLDGQLVHLRYVGPRSDPVPVVLIHGTSASLHTWEGWVAALARERRVITFDLPGFGLTGPSASGDYRGETYARFVLALLDRLQVGRAVVGGNSLGGEVAWRVAVMAPERVERLILVDAAGPAFERQSVPVGWVIASVPVLNRLMEHLLPRSMVAASVASVYGDPTRVGDELVDRYFELTLREGNRRALVQRLRQWRPGEGAERVATIAQPTLIVWGGRDRLIPPAVGRWFDEQIADSTLVVFDDLGHVPHEEDPARTVQPVLDFLAQRR
ncbi:MAG: alpha/beta hydrolase [Rubrivivax sp.]|nr:alpha/beta hydrolase [Rubrivivax sp.]